MQAKIILLASGLAMATMASTAIAQSGTNNNDNRRDGVQQDRQDRLGQASRAARQDGQLSSANNILTSLEGIWNVNILVNRTHWDAMNHSSQGVTDRGTDGTGLDSTNPKQEGDRGARERDATDPQRRDGDRTDTTTGTTTDTQSGSRTADGLARSHAILGGNILRTTVIIGADTTTTRSTTTGRTTDPQDRDAERNPQRGAERQDQERDGMPSTTTTGQMDNSHLQSMSLMGYDQQSGEYNLAFMTGQSGAIHYFTGQYDTSGRRIVFKSVDSSGSTANPSSTTGRTTTGRKGGATTTAGASMDDLTVVLQMDGNDSYSVTAYSGSASTTGSGTDLGGQPSRDDNRGNNPGQDRDADQRQGQDSRQSALAPNIIYKATYTRADGGTRSRHDRMFDEREREERNARLDRLERDRNERTPPR